VALVGVSHLGMAELATWIVFGTSRCLAHRFWAEPSEQTICAVLSRTSSLSRASAWTTRISLRYAPPCTLQVTTLQWTLMQGDHLHEVNTNICTEREICIDVCIHGQIFDCQPTFKRAHGCKGMLRTSSHYSQSNILSRVRTSLVSWPVAVQSLPTGI
jgi:hypothetical protein